MHVFDKYKKAGFDCLFFFDDSEDKKEGKWCCGFFCQGPESFLSEGLICYLPLQLYPEKDRNAHLSGLFDTPEEAINDSYTKWENEKAALAG